MSSNPKNISILGSTGSIGKSTLEVIRHLSKDFKIVALAARSQIDLLEQQVKEFSPRFVAVYDQLAATELQKRIKIPVLAGKEGLIAAASEDDIDLVVIAMNGLPAIYPVEAAIKAGKAIRLATKEVMVAAGDWLMSKIKKNNLSLIPIDSEQSALFQCLEGKTTESLRKIILTTSGGPLLHWTEEQLSRVKKEQALKHPNYILHKRMAVDSSTLMNKGFEVICAHYLFGIPLDRIEVIVHPEQCVHSLVEWNDGSLMAQISEPKMQVPIQYALTYPDRKKGMIAPFDFTKHGQWQFLPVNKKNFPCLDLAYQALKMGGSMPCFLSAANDVLVDQFLHERCQWKEIAIKLEKLLEKHPIQYPEQVEDFLAIDQEARRNAINA